MNLVTTASLDKCERKLIHKIKKKYSKVLFFEKKTKKFIANFKKCHTYIAGANINIESDLVKQSKIKLIINPNTGQDHLPIQYIKKAKINFYSYRNNKKILKNLTATSELSFGLLLTILRKINQSNESVKKGVWAREIFYGKQLKNKTIGIVGMGRLGRISAKIARGFGCKVIFYDPFVYKPKIEKKSLNIVAKNSNFIFIHVHLKKNTENLINYKFLKLVKKDCIIINTSRAKIINENDLIRFLEKNKKVGYGTDVIDGEWATKKNLLKNKLIVASKKNKNIFITSHIGGATVESISIIRNDALKKVLRSKI